MKRKFSFNQISPIIVFGSLWGLFEATIGWVMHLIHIKNTSLLLYPIAAFFMCLAIRRTGKPIAALGVAGVAALIKLTNLAYGDVPPYWVLNPAISILFEGVSVFLIYKILNNLFSKSTRLLALTEGFIIIMCMQTLFTGWRMMSSFFIASNPSILPFSLEQLVGTDALITLYKLCVLSILIYLVKNIRIDGLRLKLSWTFFICIVAIAANQI
ncbi:MAG: hypothetical protein ACRDD8_00455 [Bacteroidales bacterium]